MYLPVLPQPHAYRQVRSWSPRGLILRHELLNLLSDSDAAAMEGGEISRKCARLLDEIDGFLGAGSDRAPERLRVAAFQKTQTRQSNRLVRSTTVCALTSRTRSESQPGVSRLGRIHLWRE